MRPRMFECVELRGTADALPLHSHQSTARTANALQFGLMSVLAAAIVLPQVAIAAYVIVSPELRGIIANQPMIALQLAVALTFWIALFAWPLTKLFARLAWRRSVEITRDNVAVCDDLAFGTSNWTAPLQSYTGIAHHIRSSLSGNRHELVLVHPEPHHSVLLMVADHVSDTEVARMTALLRLPQVPASELYRVRNSAAGNIGQAPEANEWQALPA